MGQRAFSPIFLLYKIRIQQEAGAEGKISKYLMSWGELATIYQMAIRITQLFVLFKGKLIMSAQILCHIYLQVVWLNLHKAFWLPSLGLFTLNTTLRLIRDLLGGAALEKNGKDSETTPPASGIILLFAV